MQTLRYSINVRRTTPRKNGFSSVIFNVHYRKITAGRKPARYYKIEFAVKLDVSICLHVIDVYEGCYARNAVISAGDRHQASVLVHLDIIKTVAAQVFTVQLLNDFSVVHIHDQSTVINGGSKDIRLRG